MLLRLDFTNHQISVWNCLLSINLAKRIRSWEARSSPRTDANVEGSNQVKIWSQSSQGRHSSGTAKFSHAELAVTCLLLVPAKHVGIQRYKKYCYRVLPSGEA